MFNNCVSDIVDRTWPRNDAEDGTGLVSGTFKGSSSLMSLRFR
jgi:hypothetical protein